MPITPRDQEPEGVQTRSQRAAEESTAAVAGPSTVAAPASSPKPKVEIDLNTILILLKEQSRALNESREAQEEQYRKLCISQREAQEAQQEQYKMLCNQQEEQSCMLREVREAIAGWKNEITEVQEKLADMDIKFENRLHNINEKVEDFENRLRILEVKVAAGTSRTEVSGPVCGNFKVPPFDGTSSWNAYKLQFESVCQANGWSKDQAKTALTLALRDEALTVLEVLGDDRTYDRLLEALETRYGDRHLEYVYRAQLKDRSQGRNESLQKWALEIEKLVRKAYQSASASMVDSMLLQAFTDGIRDMEVRAAVRLGHHTSLKDAVAHALEVEAVRHEARPFSVRQVCVSKSPSRNREYVPRCYQCGERGHLRSSCPKRKRTHRSADSSYLGRKLRMSGDLVNRRPVTDGVGEKRNELDEIHSGVCYNGPWNSNTVRKRYDWRIDKSKFEEGSQVWLRDVQRRHWDGPYKVVTRINDVTYRIQRTQRSPCKVVHIDRLARYYGDNHARDEHVLEGGSVTPGGRETSTRMP